MMDLNSMYAIPIKLVTLKLNAVSCYNLQYNHAYYCQNNYTQIVDFYILAPQVNTMIIDEMFLNNYFSF